MDERLKLRIPCRLRKPLFLLRKSCHLHLSSLGFQRGKQQAVSLQAALQSLGGAFESQDFHSLYRCTVGLRRDDGTTAEITFTSANSQLHGLNADTESFKFGYEPDSSAMIDCFVSDDGTFVDVGANFGYFSLYLASREAFCGTVHAFEPSSRGFNDLEKLVTGFEFGNRIKIHQCALGNSTGHAELFLSNSDGFTTMVESMANRLEKTSSKQTVELRRLDDFGFQHIDLIKIDVEGAESMVIAGALNAIKACSPVVIFESWASFDDSDAFDRLLDCGYRFFVPTWENKQGQLISSIDDAVDPTTLFLVMFQPAERRSLPERLNVIAAHPEHIEKLVSRG
jgi:FkbM family methyltransferase